MAGSKRPNITLYTESTPNGIKISMALEELGLPYKVEHLNISTSVQKEPAFLKVNPNGRIPAITDTFEDGEEIRIFESGSIFQYLVEQYDPDHKLSYPAGSREHYEVNNWMFFQVRLSREAFVWSICSYFVSPRSIS
jgi:glutathione S-transferase